MRQNEQKLILPSKQHARVPAMRHLSYADVPYQMVLCVQSVSFSLKWPCVRLVALVCAPVTFFEMFVTRNAIVCGCR